MCGGGGGPMPKTTEFLYNYWRQYSSKSVAQMGYKDYLKVSICYLQLQQYSPTLYVFLSTTFLFFGQRMRLTYQVL